MASKQYANVDRDRCVSCGACENECPMSAVEVWRGCYSVVNKDVCVGCGKCARICPANCIELLQREG